MKKRKKGARTWIITFKEDGFEGVSNIMFSLDIFFLPLNNLENKKIESVFKTYCWDGCRDRTIIIKLILAPDSEWMKTRLNGYVENITYK